MSTDQTERDIARVGRICGVAADNIVAFRGIPYAAPPVGERRFAPPAPSPPWHGIRDAAREGPIAPQTPSRVDGVMGPIEAPQDEDCLTLTIWTPADADAKAPVMVWLHGGGFITGAGSLPWYDGGALAARQGVVVVGVNYRLGALGFLSLKDKVPGNLGLLDQIAALRWVRAHIAAFGGDPEAITVMGQSGGAHNIASLLATRGTEGLFRRAILQSTPLAIGLAPAAEAARRAEIFLRHLGLDGDAPDLLGRLRRVPIAGILEAQTKTAMELSAAGRGDLRPPFLPAEGPPHDVPSDRLLATAAANAAARGIAVMIGWTAEEANLYLPGNPAMRAMDEAQLLAAATAMVGGERAGAAIAARRHARPGAPPVQILLDLITEASFAAPSREMAATVAREGGRAFVYRFDWASPMPGLGACHCLDIPFALGTWRSWLGAPMMAGADETAAAALSADMMRRWADFARTGDPGFPPVRDGRMPIMSFDNESRVI